MNTAPPSINLALMAWKLAQIRMWGCVILPKPIPREHVEDGTPTSTEYYHVLRRIEDGEQP
jgi:hypothetical protein